MASLLLGLAALYWVAPATASDAPEISILQLGTDRADPRALEGFRARLSSRGQSSVTEYVDLNQTMPGLLQSRVGDNEKILVALGSATAEKVLASELTQPLLALMIHRAEFLRLRARYPDREGFTAVFTDQPISRQFAAVARLLPGAERICTLLGGTSGSFQQELASAAAGHGLKLTNLLLKVNDKPQRALVRIADQCDLLLAVTDPMIYNATSLRSLMLSAYHRRIPVLGYSPAFVRAGALAGLFTRPYHLGEQAADMVDRMVKTGTVPAPEYPRRFQIIYNERVAHRWRLALPSPQEVVSEINVTESGDRAGEADE